MRIEQSTLDFLNDLRQNNYREWFHAQKPRYEEAKRNVLAVASAVIAGINEFDSSLGHLDPKKAMFRIARDTRFSASKEPYKTHFGLAFSPFGIARGRLSCYYMHIDPTEFFVSCGVYMAPPDVLKAVREAIDDEWETFHGIISDKTFRKEFGDLSREDKVLKRVPQGFDKDSPAAEYLKLTEYYVWKPLPGTLLTDEKLIPEVLRYFRLMQPLMAFLNRAIENK